MEGAWNIMGIEYKDSKRISMISNVTFEQASNNDSRTFGVSGRTALGVKLSAGHSLVGSTVRTFSVIINQDPSGAGDIKAYVIRSGYGSNDQVAESTASTLPTGTGNTTFNLTFTFSSDVSILANDIIAFTNVGMTSVSSVRTSSSDIDPNAEALCVVSGTAFTFSDFVTMSGTYNNLAYKTTSTGDVKPTNVQDNSILVEKDTGKRYWFESESSETLSQETESGTGELFNDVEIVAQKFTTGSSKIGKKVSSVAFYLKRNTSTIASTNLQCFVGAGNQSSAVAYGTLPATSLTTSYAWYTFTPSVAGTERTLVADDRIMIRWADGSTTTDAVRMASDQSGNNPLANETGQYSSNDGSSFTDRSFDYMYKIISTTPATWNVPSKTPAEIGDLLAHYDATVGVTASSNSVSAWADQSGNGNTLSSVSNPTRVEASLNGKDYLDFNSSKSMRATGLSETAPRPCSMVAVINPRSAGNQTIIRWSQSQYLSLKQDPTNTYWLSGGDSLNLTDSTLDGSWNAFFMDFKSNADGGTLQINIDTANAVSGDIGTNGTSGTTATLHVGINADNNNWYGNCRYAEIIIFDKVLTAYEKEQLYGHLKTKWGLP